jgi:hypothetical protein
MLKHLSNALFCAESNSRIEESSMKRLGWRRWLILIAFLPAASATAGLQNFTVP